MPITEHPAYKAYMEREHAVRSGQGLSGLETPIPEEDDDVASAGGASGGGGGGGVDKLEETKEEEVVDLRKFEKKKVIITMAPKPVDEVSKARNEAVLCFVSK